MHPEFTVDCSVGGGVNVLPSLITGLMPIPHTGMYSQVNSEVNQYKSLPQASTAGPLVLHDVANHSASLDKGLKVHIYLCECAHNVSVWCMCACMV